MNIIGRNEGTKQVSEGQLNLIDLAGSERINKSEVAGIGQKEAININQSLTALAGVVAAMAENGKKAAGAKKRHVPYRDSKLTHLLQTSLQGSGKMLMFVNVSPLATHLEETYCSMRFAIKAGGVERGENHIEVNA